jgi:hypothetical protein
MSRISAKTRILLKMFYPQRKTPDPRHAIPEADKDLTGKTIVFTGGTNGKPHHAEAQSDAKRAQIKQITDKALSKWL